MSRLNRPNFKEYELDKSAVLVGTYMKDLDAYCETLETALNLACEKLEYCSKVRGVFNVRCDKKWWNKYLVELAEYEEYKKELELNELFSD